MVIVDSSAIIAILFDEPEALPCAAALKKASLRLISAVNYVETGTVLAGRIRQGDRQQAIGDLDDFLTAFGIDIAPLDEAIARAALKARLAFGKGFRSRGGLNFGDCFAYALAQVEGEGLLFKGDDFPQTDVKPAI